MAEKGARLVIVAIVDEGAVGRAAGIAPILGQEAVAGREVVDVGDPWLRHPGQAVERHGLIDHGRGHCVVARAREDVDLVIGQVRERIDLALVRERLGALQQVRGIRRTGRGLHAAVEGDPELALGAVVGATSDDRSTHEGRRERDVELAGHVGAGRQAGDRALREIDMKGRQRIGGPRRRRQQAAGDRGEEQSGTPGDGEAPDLRPRKAERVCTSASERRLRRPISGANNPPD